MPQFSFIRTITVGSGIAPDLLTLLPKGARGLFLYSNKEITAGGELHPALRIARILPNMTVIGKEGAFLVEGRLDGRTFDDEA